MTQAERIKLVIDHWHMSCAFCPSVVFESSTPSRERVIRLREFVHWCEVENESEEEE